MATPLTRPHSRAIMRRSTCPWWRSLSGFVRAETSKVFATPSGEKPPYYRMAEFWFESEAAMAAAMGSPEGRAVEGDLANFATGGVTILISAVE